MPLSFKEWKVVHYLLRGGIATQCNCNFSAWEICLFSYIFKFLLSLIFYQYELYIYFIFWIIIQYYFVLLLKLFHFWSLRAFLFGIPPTLCILLLLFWSTFFLSATTTYSGEILYVSYPSPKSEFSPRAIIPVVGEWYEKQALWFPHWWVWKSGQEEDELLYNFKANQEGKEYSHTKRELKFLF